MTDLEHKIRSLIQRDRRITFAKFMEIALYEPGLGYYSSGQDRIGAQGDFYTSPVTHPVFAALIAVQLEELWIRLGSPAVFGVVEMGANKGLLADDIISYLPNLIPDFAAAVRYITIEHDGVAVCRYPRNEKSFSIKNMTGCVISNELVDAMPVNRVKVVDGQLQELYVAFNNETFVEMPEKPSTPALAERLERENINLSKGYVTEINLGIDVLMRKIAEIIRQGFVLTIDYGFSASELYAPSRDKGSLVTYFHHNPGSNPFINVGEQDITAHVDFTAVSQAGNKYGLNAEGVVTQGSFLSNLGIKSMLENLARLRLPYAEYLANRAAMLELVRPEGFGEFRVLVQSTNFSGESLSGLRERSAEFHQRIAKLPVPLLGPAHLPLARGRQPFANI